LCYSFFPNEYNSWFKEITNMKKGIHGYKILKKNILLTTIKSDYIIAFC
jgi:hypothetical protein